MRTSEHHWSTVKLFSWFTLQWQMDYEVKEISIPWLKVLISGHSTFTSYPCTHMKIMCEKVKSGIIKLSKSALNKDLIVEAKEIRLPCLLAGHGQHSFCSILGERTSWTSPFPWPFPPCIFCWVLVIAAEWKCAHFLNSCADSHLLLGWVKFLQQHLCSSSHGIAHLDENHFTREPWIDFKAMKLVAMISHLHVLL